MTVEIWSDVACPFCWLGKRRFERALADFEGAAPDVVWRSFQLDPSLRTDPGVRLEDHLAHTKRMEPWLVRQMNERVARMGEAEGIAFRFDGVVVANTFDAHRLIQLAEARGRQGQVEERLFRAYFEEGRDLSDHPTLAELAGDAGLDPDEAARGLAGHDWADEVRADVEEALGLGITGVPFFVFDRRLAVSGAQDVEVFRDVLERVGEDQESRAGG